MKTVRAWAFSFFVWASACGSPAYAPTSPFAPSGETPGVLRRIADTTSISDDGGAFILGFSSPGNLGVFRDQTVTRRGPVAPVLSATLVGDSDAVLAVSRLSASSPQGTGVQESRFFLSYLSPTDTWRRSFPALSSVEPAPFVAVLGDRVLVSGSGRATFLNLQRGVPIPTELSLFGVTSAARLGDGRILLSHREGVLAIDEATLTPRCSFPNTSLAGGVLFDGTPAVSPPLVALAEGGKIQVTHLLPDCTTSTSWRGLPSGLVEGGTAILIHKSDFRTPWPAFVGAEARETQLLVVDEAGIPLRTVGLPDGTTLAVPTRDVSRIFVRASDVSGVLDVSTGRLTYVNVEGMLVGSARNREVLVSFDEVSARSSLLRVKDLDARTMRFPDHRIAGAFRDNFLFRPKSVGNPYLVVSAENGGVLEQIAF